jgi:ribose-phosphate pyrophosphokinase
MAETIKELGAKKVCLVSPYLSYMRQDKRFNPGEANTSSLFAKLLSGWLDCLITIDPHLHRIKNLTEIYSIHSISVLHATKLIAEWINLNVDKPILIGPDEESAQWVSEIAASIHAPFVISNKVRSGDRNVSITVPPIKNLGNVPVLVDDIISTGESMIASLQQVLLQGFKNPICIGVHALFNNEVEKRLLLSGAEQIITCNTIPHLSNKIDITDMIVKGIIEVC